MAAPTKIKVSREALLDKLRDVEASQENGYQQAFDQYNEDVLTFRDDLAEALSEFASQLISGKADTEDRVHANYKNGLYVNFPNLTIPVRPGQSGDDLGKLIRTLEMSTEDTIVVSASDNYYRYI